MTTKLLHVSASPRGEMSESLALAGQFLNGFRTMYPDIPVEEWDLWDGTLPEFGQSAVDAKMTAFVGQRPSGAAADAWASVEDTFRRFDSADLYLFSIPMWNSGVPYIVKQLIDVITQPGLAFVLDPRKGYTGLLEGKKAAVIYTSAVYGPGCPATFGSDFLEPFFASWLRMVGITDIATVSFQPNLLIADRETARVASCRAARELGRGFGNPIS